jgi:hypothetical protein
MSPRPRHRALPGAVPGDRSGSRDITELKQAINARPTPICSWRSPTWRGCSRATSRRSRAQRGEADAARAGDRAGQQREAAGRDRARVRDHAAAEAASAGPDALRNSPDIKIEFVSLLTQMQRMVGLGDRAQRPVRRRAHGHVPNARFKLDPFEMVDEYAQDHRAAGQAGPLDRGRAGRRRCRSTGAAERTDGRDRGQARQADQGRDRRGHTGGEPAGCRISLPRRASGSDGVRSCSR